MKSVNTPVADFFLDKRYVLQMGIREKLSDEQIEQVRDDFKAFSLEIGYGAGTDLAEDFKIPRTRLSDWKNGGRLGDRSVKKIASGLNRHGALTAEGLPCYT